MRTPVASISRATPPKMVSALRSFSEASKATSLRSGIIPENSLRGVTCPAMSAPATLSSARASSSPPSLPTGTDRRCAGSKVASNAGSVSSSKATSLTWAPRARAHSMSRAG